MAIDDTSVTGTQPSWRQLAVIPESVLKASVLKACGVVPPAAGVSRTFDGGSFRVFANVPPWHTQYRGCVVYVVPGHWLTTVY